MTSNDDTNKMPSLSLTDYNNDVGSNGGENEEQTFNSKETENRADYQSFDNPMQSPYFVNAAEVAMINGRQAIIRKKSHKLRNAILIILAVLIVGFVCSYIFVPAVKDSVNKTVLTPKSVF